MRTITRAYRGRRDADEFIEFYYGQIKQTILAQQQFMIIKKATQRLFSAIIRQQGYPPFMSSALVLHPQCIHTRIHSSYSSNNNQTGSKDSQQQSQQSTSEKKQKFENQQERHRQSDGQTEMVEMGDRAEGEVVERNYDELSVPGAKDKRYAGLDDFQKGIIGSGSFNLSDPKVIPKASPASSFPGINQQLTQISLGNALIRGEHEVFLSEVDPSNIPADLDIRFDSMKEVRIIGSAVDEPNPNAGQSQIRASSNLKMTVDAETIQHKSMNEFIGKQFDGMKVRLHYGKGRYRRLDLLLVLLMILLGQPITTTLGEYYACLKSTKGVEDERMKEVEALKKRSFQQALLENREFNRLTK